MNGVSIHLLQHCGAAAQTFLSECCAESFAVERKKRESKSQKQAQHWKTKCVSETVRERDRERGNERAREREIQRVREREKTKAAFKLQVNVIPIRFFLKSDFYC